MTLGTPLPASMRAVEPTRVVKVTSEVFHTLAAMAPEVSATVGALALGELCAEMERAGKAGDTRELNALLPRFESELAAVDKYIESLA